MHILMISDVFFPRVNGVSTSIATFRASLSETGQHESTLIVPRYGTGDPVEPDVLRVAARRVPMDPEDRLMSGQALTHTLSRIDASRVDIVHIQTPFIAHSAGVRWARAHRVPVIETWHTHFEEYFTAIARDRAGSRTRRTSTSCSRCSPNCGRSFRTCCS